MLSLVHLGTARPLPSLPSGDPWLGAGVEPRPVEQHRDIGERVLALRALDFRFVTNLDTSGLLVALVGVRAHRGVIDIVQLYSEHDADAVRIPGDEPDIMFPRTILWRTTGSADYVIDSLLDLADP
jgi:hypothetical protein